LHSAALRRLPRISIHTSNLAHFADRGLVKPPFFVQCIFGILGGIGADYENLLHMRAIADRLFGNDYHLSVLAAGKHQLPCDGQAAASDTGVVS
jgi:uncharacterized protein (DUF849 family)